MEWLKKLLTNFWFYVVLFVLSLVIPFVINEAYQYGHETGNGYMTIWGAEEVFDFFGNYLSFFGTVILGAAAVFQTERANELAKKATEQTDKANELAAQMQKLEQAKFVSMVSINKVQLFVRAIKQDKFRNKDMPNQEIINLTVDESISMRYYHIDAMVRNDSDYPIVQILVHAGEYGSRAALFYGIEDKDRAIYIPPHSEQAIRFIVPTAVFEEFNRFGLSLRIGFINVYDYLTRATLHIEDLENKYKQDRFSYRLAKFTDVKPQTSEQEIKEVAGVE